MFFISIGGVRLMREIGSKEIKQIQLDMLLVVYSYCKKNNLNYFMCGGTLLGAVRHKGFIPWDDDIDILMPRKDYEWLLHNFNIGRKDTYKVASVEIGDEMPMMAGIFNTSTLLQFPDGREYDDNKHVFVDIFPIDDLSNNKFIRVLTCYVKEMLIYCYLSSILDFVPTKRYLDRDGGMFEWRAKVRTLIKYILVSLLHKTRGRFWGCLINRVSRIWEGKDTNYQGCMVTGAHHNNGLSEILPKEIFSSAVKLEFEGHQLNAMVGYKEYLTSLYGDYMKLPPKEKQVSHHDFIAYIKE